MSTLTHLHRLADRALGAIVLLERTRDPAGQFAPQQPPGMDAMTMRTAYNQKHNAQRQSTAARVAKTAATVGGLVGVGVLAHKAGSRSGFQKGAVAAGNKWKAKRAASTNARKEPNYGKTIADRIARQRAGLDD